MHFVAHPFAGCPHFCLRDAVGLIVGLDIGGAVLIVDEIGISLSKRFFLN